MKKQRIKQVPENCPICLHPIEKKEPIELSVTSLYHCERCGVVFANPNFQNESGDFFDVYRVRQWLAYYKPFRSRTHEKFLFRYRLLFSSIRSVLDIGCAAGWFLDEIRKGKHKLLTSGLEPSPSIKFVTNKKHKIYRISAENMAAVKGKFDLISFWNVFEHFSDPHKILSLVSKKLKPSGLLILSVPNRDGLISRMSYILTKVTNGQFRLPLEELFQTNNAFGHLFHYNRSSLDRLLGMHSFYPLVWEGADIVDVSNVQQRLNIDKLSHRGINKKILANVVAILTRLAGTIGMQDELVVIARLMPGK